MLVVPSHKRIVDEISSYQSLFGLAGYAAIWRSHALEKLPGGAPYLLVIEEKKIPPVAQRSMSERPVATVVETPGSHAIHVSRPETVAALINQAANYAKIAAA